MTAVLGQRAQLQNAQRHDRIGQARLEHHEEHEQDDGEAEDPQRVRREPAVRRRRHDAVDGNHHRHGDERGPHPVDALFDAQADVLHNEEAAEDQRGDADRHIHEEDPVPAQELGQDAAGEETDGAAADGDEHVGAHRLAALEGARELGDDDGDDHRGGERAADALDEAGRDEHGLAVGRSAGDGGEHEQGHAGQEHLLATDQVAEAAGEKEEAAEGDEVGVDDPGQAGLAEEKALLNVRERHVDDGAVEGVHEHGQADDDQGYPAPAVAGCARVLGNGPYLFDSHDFGIIL